MLLYKKGIEMGKEFFELFTSAIFKRIHEREQCEKEGKESSSLYDWTAEDIWLDVYNYLSDPDEFFSFPNDTHGLKIKCAWYQRVIRFVCYDNCVTLFSRLTNIYINDPVNFVFANQLPTKLYNNSLAMEEMALSLSDTDSKFKKSVVYTMKIYQKEYMKYYLVKYLVPHAVLHKQKRMPKEVISRVLSYL